MQAVAGVLLLAYWTVLVAELVGDKSIYTVASLTMRFSWRRVLPGISAAFACKMLAAVLLGNSLVHMSGKWLALVSAITFFGTAAAFWLRDPDKVEKALKLHHWSGAVAVSFAAVFFSEWADPGQIAAAFLTARYKLPLAVWTAGTLAMLTKALLAMTVGVKLRDYLPTLLLRRIAATSCLLLGTISLVELFLEQSR